MGKMKNPYTATSLEPGDVMCVTVKLMVCHHKDGHGKPYYKLYCCPYPDPVPNGIPQGDRMYRNAAEVAEVLFPIAAWVGLQPDGGY